MPTNCELSEKWVISQKFSHFTVIRWIWTLYKNVSVLRFFCRAFRLRKVAAMDNKPQVSIGRKGRLLWVKLKTSNLFKIKRWPFWNITPQQNEFLGARTARYRKNSAGALKDGKSPIMNNIPPIYKGRGGTNRRFGAGLATDLGPT